MPTADAFTKAVESALEQLTTPELLGQHSPLAAPYFLGEHLNESASDAKSRGMVLISLLRQVARTLTDDQQAVLNVAYFESQHYSPVNELRASTLHRSLRTYYRDRTAATRALAEALGRLIIPPVRAESPRVRPMIGRSSEMAIGQAALHAGRSLALTGASGSGKTTLGSHLSANWPHGIYFWFTIRPGFSDSASALLFGLCHYLHSLGATSAWHQLIAEAGKDQSHMELRHIRPMLRYDLEKIRNQYAGQGHPLLVCIDDIDLLDPARAEHDRLLDVIRELRDLVSIMLIGQQLSLDADEHIRLSGLASDEIATLLQHRQGIDLLPAEVDHLTRVIHGLPALAQLFSLLHQLGEPIEQTLRGIEGEISIDLLFQRTWVRLSESARQVLRQISVYDGFAPADEWHRDEAAITLLTQFGILERNAHDGIGISSSARTPVLRRVLPEQRSAFHLQAAAVLERRGEYTAAARQYARAGQYLHAMAVWGEHRAAETERGHAEAALAMLRGISPSALQSDDERRILATLLAELLRKLGAPTEGIEAIHVLTWPITHPLTPQTQTLLGDLIEFSGGIESATHAYERALAALTTQREATQSSVLRKMGFIHLYRSRNLDQAEQLALHARFESESFHGRVLEEQGDFAAAEIRFQAAAQLLPFLQNASAARAHNESDLGRVAMMRGQYEQTIAHLHTAINLYTQIGDRTLVAHEHMNLSFALNSAERFEDALDIAAAQLAFVEARGDTYLVSALACNAAESCAQLHRLEEAEQYLALALRQEEGFHRHYILTVEGIIQSKRQHFDTAIHRLNEAIHTAQESEDPFGEAPAWRWLARVHLMQGQSAEAKTAATRARTLYQSMGMSHEITALDRWMDNS